MPQLGNSFDVMLTLASVAEAGLADYQVSLEIDSKAGEKLYETDSLYIHLKSTIIEPTAEADRVAT
ncbi:MAG: hypothetical protein MJ195_02860 [Mycoplasmoidaceae bacterium]|nr:hypothetical protein [Mycoplasmoidaceae bacterium]